MIYGDFKEITVLVSMNSHIQGVFIAWRRLSRRTYFLSRELGLELFFVPDNPLYLKAVWRTWRFLSIRKPSLVFLQLPQGPLLAEVIATKDRQGFRVVADVHTGFIYPTSIKERVLNRPFHRFLRRVDLVLAHNVLQAELIKKKTGIPSEKIVLVYDPVPKIPEKTNPPLLNRDLGKTVVFPASWAIDEPLDYIVVEFLESELARDHTLVITGNWERNKRLYRRLIKAIREKKARDKVVLTGYMPDEEYYHLIKSCKAIIAMSSKEYTFPHALWEAVAVEKPFITLKTETTLTEVGRDYPCFFTMKTGSLRKTLEYCLDKGHQKAQSAAKIKAEKLKYKSQDSLRKLVKNLYEIQ